MALKKRHCTVNRQMRQGGAGAGGAQVSVGVMTTYSVDLNVNLTTARHNTGIATISFEKEHRLAVHQSMATPVATYQYGPDGLESTEKVDGALTTLVWTQATICKGGPELHGEHELLFS